MSKKAGVIGATGEVGHHLVSQLIKSGEYSQVTIFSRRKIDIETTNPDVLVIFAVIVLIKDFYSDGKLFLTLISLMNIKGHYKTANLYSALSVQQKPKQAQPRPSNTLTTITP